MTFVETMFVYALVSATKSCQVFMKFGIGILQKIGCRTHMNLMKNRLCDRHTSLKGVN